MNKTFNVMSNMKSKKLSNLFSEETLDSISKAVLIGGDKTNNCNGENCSQNCACPVKANVNMVEIACINQSDVSNSHNQFY